MEVDGLEL